MSKEIRRAGVLGAGVMGSGIAAHLANAGIEVLLLDIVPRDLSEADRAKGLTREDPRFRSKLAMGALEKLQKSKPAALYSKRFLSLIQVGNFEDDWDKLADCDWIVEVVVERMEIKQKLFARVEEVRRPGTLVSSNTSGLSIAGMMEGRSAEFKGHFLVTHFFNPVRYMRLLELVASKETLPEVLAAFANFGRFRLGKGIVFGKDTPNFVGNRIGVYGIAATLQAMVEMDYQVDEVDSIVGPALGRPSSAAFGTIDLVGLDVLAHVIGTLRDGCPDDEKHDVFTIPGFMAKLIEAGALGRKTREKGGFFRMTKVDGKKTKLVLDWKTGEYRASEKLRTDSLKWAKRTHDVRERLGNVVFADDRAGAFAWRVTRDTLIYASRRHGEISDTLVELDNAMKWGFNWELGPFEIWDALGVAKVVEKMAADGEEPGKWVLEMLEAGHETFYVESAEGRKFYDPATGEYRMERKPQTFMVLSQIKRKESNVLYKNDGASVVDLGDGVACLEFHSALQPKLNPVDDEILEAAYKAIEIAEGDFRGLVVHHQGENFSAGANLMMVLQGIFNKDWDAIGEMIRKFQGMTMGLRRARVPVVTAPFGYTFGGGCEISMAGDRICAAAESYMGLVEVGVGLIPAGGGCLFLLERLLEGIDPPILSNLPFVEKAFQTIGMAKVATSGEEARELGFLRSFDKVELNRDQQLWTAKRMVLGMAEEGYQPCLPKKLHLPGKEGIATIEMQLYNMKETHWISEYDALLGAKLARVLCGGDTTINDPVDEQTILDLERETFVSLCGEQKTLARIQHMLETNKPLRN